MNIGIYWWKGENKEKRGPIFLKKRTQQSNKKLLFQFNGIEFRYFCRQMTSNLEGETLPVDPDGNLTYTNLQPIPSTAWRPNGTQGGCFGLGPGENISV